MKTQLQSGSKYRQFSKDRPFTSRGLFWLKKCVFDRSRVADRRYVFAKLTDRLISADHGCLDCATQKSCPGHFYTVTKLRNPSPSSAPRDLRTHVFPDYFFNTKVRAGDRQNILFDSIWCREVYRCDPCQWSCRRCAYEDCIVIELNKPGSTQAKKANRRRSVAQKEHKTVKKENR